MQELKFINTFQWNLTFIAFLFYEVPHKSSFYFFNIYFCTNKDIVMQKVLWLQSEHASSVKLQAYHPGQRALKHPMTSLSM